MYQYKPLVKVVTSAIAIFFEIIAISVWENIYTAEAFSPWTEEEWLAFLLNQEADAA